MSRLITLAIFMAAAMVCYSEAYPKQMFGEGPYMFAPRSQRNDNPTFLQEIMGVCAKYDDVCQQKPTSLETVCCPGYVCVKLSVFGPGRCRSPRPRFG